MEALMRSSLGSIALLMAFFQLTFSQTSVPPGNVSGTWKFIGSPYLVQGDITVPTDSTLTVAPGVRVVFQGHYALYIQGRLLAIGTATDPISFTVNDTTGFSNSDTTRGGWNGIRLINTPAWNDSTILSYCSLEYGKAVGPGWPSNTGGAISIGNFSKVRISNCLVAHNMAGGSLLPGGGGIGLTGANVALEGNLITGNRSTGQGGGLLLNGSNVRSMRNRFVGNTTSGQGGGVLIEGTCKLLFQGDSIASNSSLRDGGGIYAYGQREMTMEGVSVVSNVANWGGGVGVVSCTLSVSNCAFSNNIATLDGGAISANFSSLNVGASMFNANRSTSEGGGIYTHGTDLRIRSSSIVSNRAGKDTATGVGGAIYAEWGSLRLDSCSFLRDTAWTAAGLRVYNCDLRADSVLIKEHCTYSMGGGLYWAADSMIFGRPYALSLRRSSFLRNKATSTVAGAYLVQPIADTSLADVIVDQCEFRENSASVTPALTLSGTFKGLIISNSSFQQNTAGSRTSGLSFAGGARGRVFNCLFAGNHTAGGSSVGAGLSMGANSEIDIVNCTFAYNAAVSGSALSVRSGAKGRVTNSVFWRNTGMYIALATASSSGGHLDVNYCNMQSGHDSTSVSDSLSTLVWGIGNIDGDPRFKDTLAADFHLSGASHCIAAGIDSIKIDGVWTSAPATDIEGLARPGPRGTRPDMGAFEDQFTNPVGVGNQVKGARPSTYELDQNYPNPFNPSTTIRYGLPHKSTVALIVYNTLGQLVAQLVNGEQEAGYHEVQFDGRSLATGVYFYRIQAGDFVQTRRLLLLK